MAETVLFVDDEPNVRAAMQRLFAESDLNVALAADGREALSLICAQPVAVVVADYRMPGMSGTELLERVRDLSPETVRVMLTGYAELQTALDAINLGEVFRFVLKPWENEHLRAVVEEALARYRLVLALRDADESTLLSLAQMIELKDAYTRGHCERVAAYALRIAAALNFDAQRTAHIRRGSWLHDCGKVGVPESILNFQGPLNSYDFNVVRNHPRWGAEVARKARLEREIVNMILFHHERWDGEGYPHGLQGEQIPLEARIVATADVYDALTSDRPYQKAMTPARAASVMHSLAGTQLDPRLTELLLAELAREEKERRP
ncbi:HD-GYP domain-containing protein [Geoalkalibacter halelectricus]|uniref:Response regulator n=1 Tax=Geoalkalibacter halelectricus TaxID=2847045 RepID=A0ABY5ZP28_9BACT|nr:HD domain-containing phosphohydrolase [Geoalkalibacter halelectricus]MDO3377418.1 response regulator [Geoalkalibacter halelectricus]UWZ80823.1 response regulator [Geoalkalibacter halelectricus]